MDYYEFLTPNSKAYYKGRFFEERVDSNNPDNSGQVFFYEEISPYASSVGIAFGSVLGIEGSMTIRTRANLTIGGHKLSEYKIEQKVYQSAYILTAEKRLYRINRIEIDKTVDGEANVPFKALRPVYLLWLVPTKTGVAWINE